MIISVVIPNWNGKQFLAPCLDSLLAQTWPDVEIIIADNASTDGSQAFIEANYPQVKLLALDKNYGFTGACNAGMEAATGGIVTLLNNDTEVDPSWLSEVHSAFERYPAAGIVASKMLLFDQRDTFHTAGDVFYTNGTPGNRGVWQKDTDQFAEGPVFSACGGSSAYKKEMLDEVGLLDNDFFFSCEDVDIAWRAHLQGWETIYAPNAVVYHHLKATGGGTTASFYDGRNFIYVLVKNLPTGLWRKYRGEIIAKQWAIAMDALKAWRGDAARATLKGQLTGITHIPRLLKKRRAIQRTKTASDAAIEALLTPVDV